MLEYLEEFNLCRQLVEALLGLSITQPETNYVAHAVGSFKGLTDICIRGSGDVYIDYIKGTWSRLFLLSSSS